MQDASGSKNPKYRLGSEANRIFMAAQAYGFLDFGRSFPTEQGGSGWLNDDGSLDHSQGIQTWITCRMTHVYSIGAMLGYDGAQELVHEGVRGLLSNLHDDEHGGWYPSKSWEGEPEASKSCYTHAFVLLASSSALLAGDPDGRKLFDMALETFNKYFWDEEEGLAVDTWNTEFTQLDPYRGLNANMHSTEAFLAVADATQDERYRQRAGRIIDHVIGWAQGNGWRIPEHFNEAWQAQLDYNEDNKADQFKPYGATPGHGIEWARLITQYALSALSSQSERQPYIEAAEHLFAQAVEDGWNSDGAPGLAYTTDWEGKPVVHDRMHWTLAEALNTSATLYRATGNTEYGRWYETFCQYVDQYVIDHEQGSWFHQLDEHNQMVDTVWPGKSDLYHAFQATLVPYHNPAVSIASSVKQAAGRELSLSL